MVRVDGERRHTRHEGEQRIARETRVQIRQATGRRIEIAPDDTYELRGGGATTRPQRDPSTRWNAKPSGMSWEPLVHQPAPTPLRSGEVPGQEVHVNTIQNPRVAPKSQLRGAVNAAIDKVRAAGIGMDPNDPERNTIADFDAYHGAVVAELRRQGYNAAHDGEELAVNRPGDGFSEQFDISTSGGKVRRFYAAWLSPPVFEPGAGDRPRADPSGLTPSQIRDVPDQTAHINTIQNRNVAPRSQYADEVNAAIDYVRRQGIGIDTNDPERNRISSFDLYHHAVVMELRRRGFNAAHDGEELAINRPGDRHSEQFDISTWTGSVRRFYAAWLSPPVF
jgi:hypothetical protein